MDLEILDRFGFPVAACAVLVGYLTYFMKQSLNIVKEYLKAAEEKQVKNDEFWKSTIKDLAGIIATNSTAYNNIALAISDIRSLIDKIVKK